MVGGATAVAGGVESAIAAAAAAARRRKAAAQGTGQPARKLIPTVFRFSGEKEIVDIYLTIFQLRLTPGCTCR